MTEDFKINVAQPEWNFSWTFGEKHIVQFTKTNSCTSAKYSACELKRLLELPERESAFICVPRHVMENALRVIEPSDNLAA